MNYRAYVGKTAVSGPFASEQEALNQAKFMGYGEVRPMDSSPIPEEHSEAPTASNQSGE